VQPRVEASGAVDARHHTYTRCSGRMVDVRETIDARERVVILAIYYPVDDARRTCGRGDFTRFEHIERQRIVGLVACAVSHGRPFGKPQLLGSPGSKTSLL